MALVPNLSLVEAHGKLPPAEMDAVMMRFADGHGDVLLSTNIVETGLDVPRANTMLIWRADRFGLAQLHQLRGRVGRGAARGVAYLLTDLDHPPARATQRRLAALEAMDHLGAGFAISVRDLDMRGGGDLVGDAQAGHAKLLGVELYQSLLADAVRRARGGAPAARWVANIVAPIPAYLPAEYMPNEAMRVMLYTRIGRLLRDGDHVRLEALAPEICDRFGPMPKPVEHLLALSLLRVACRRRGVSRLDVGPEAVAATFHDAVPAVDGLERHEARLILRRHALYPAGMLSAADALLTKLPVVMAELETTPEVSVRQRSGKQVA